MNYKKYYLTQEQGDYLRRNSYEQWTNPHSGWVSDQHYAEVDGVRYWLDLGKDNELISAHDAKMVWSDEICDSDMADTLTAEEYAVLVQAIADSIDRNIKLDRLLKVAFDRIDAEKVTSADQLISFITKLNAKVIEKSNEQKG